MKNYFNINLEDLFQQSIPSIEKIINDFFKCPLSIVYKEVDDMDDGSQYIIGFINFDNINVPFTYSNLSKEYLEIDLSVEYYLQEKDSMALLISSEAGQIYKADTLDYLTQFIDLLPSEKSRELYEICTQFAGIPNNISFSNFNYSIELTNNQSVYSITNYYEGKKYNLAYRSHSYFNYNFPVPKTFVTNTSFNVCDLLPAYLSMLYTIDKEFVKSIFDFSTMKGLNDYIDNQKHIESLIQMQKV